MSKTEKYAALWAEVTAYTDARARATGEQADSLDSSAYDIAVAELLAMARDALEFCGLRTHRLLVFRDPQPALGVCGHYGPIVALEAGGYRVFRGHQDEQAATARRVCEALEFCGLPLSQKKPMPVLKKK